MKEKLKKDSGVAKEAAYDSIVKRLLSKESAKGQSYSYPRCDGIREDCEVDYCKMDEATLPTFYHLDT